MMNAWWILTLVIPRQKLEVKVCGCHFGEFVPFNSAYDWVLWGTVGPQALKQCDIGRGNGLLRQISIRENIARKHTYTRVDESAVNVDATLLHSCGEL